MKTQTIKLPTKVVKANWKDDVDYEEYTNEKEYISPESVKKETIARIKKSPIKLAIRNMIDWDKITKKVAA